MKAHLDIWSKKYRWTAAYLLVVLVQSFGLWSIREEGNDRRLELCRAINAANKATSYAIAGFGQAMVAASSASDKSLSPVEKIERQEALDIFSSRMELVFEDLRARPC